MGKSCGRKEVKRRALCVGCRGGGEESGHSEAGEMWGGSSQVMQRFVDWRR